MEGGGIEREREIKRERQTSSALSVGPLPQLSTASRIDQDTLGS